MCRRPSSPRGYLCRAPPAESLSPGEELPWGVPRIEAVKAGAVTKPLGVVVGVVDTGIDEGHPDLNVAGGMSFIPGSSYKDQNGHGGCCEDRGLLGC